MTSVIEIRKLAKRNEWDEIEGVKDSSMVSFMKNGARVNVWFVKMTVGTYIDHPRRGKTQLFRKRVHKKMLEEIFKNPRVHTGRGYK